MNSNYDFADVKEGQLCVCTWGYDQTNVDFFQVVRTTAKSFWIKPIYSKTIESFEGMESYKIPLKDNFFNDDDCKRFYSGKNIMCKRKQCYVSVINSRGFLRKCDENQKFLETSYA